MSGITIAALYRHPVKGLAPEEVGEAALEIGGHFPGDRLFAVENGSSGFDPAAPEHLPKLRFLTLMRFERLARLESRYEPASRRLSLLQGGRLAAAGNVDAPEGRAAIERFLEAFLANDGLRGPLRFITAPDGHRFMDSRSGFVSLLNRASVAAIAAMIGRETLSLLRFRANIHLDGVAEWAEFALVGQTIRLGTAELEITKRIDRCAAIDVEPGAGLRDTRLVETLERACGHHDCGVYARIVRGGTIRPGDRLEIG